MQRSQPHIIVAARESEQREVRKQMVEDSTELGQSIGLFGNSKTGIRNIFSEFRYPSFIH